MVSVSKTGEVKGNHTGVVIEEFTQTIPENQERDTTGRNQLDPSSRHRGRSAPPSDRYEADNEERGLSGDGCTLGLGFSQQVSNANDSGDA